ncbi:preprotein translocase subunit SecE [Tropheryma whipplei]|uniref:Protein translocase subunit SecE n=1 Tax=Tropheryma whipplei (strain Twist) TaxID=203267 RepID=Q83FK7_TROWT|nr:preprotein translocase subunit SecE [Tropheryma whipplei]AAO44813.1 unknown [Tropheryma whipplei str. Twist]
MQVQGWFILSEKAARRFFGRIVNFLREVFQELSKVTVPTRRAVVSFSFMVSIFVIVVIGLVAFVDWIFALLLTLALGSSS